MIDQKAALDNTEFKNLIEEKVRNKINMAISIKDKLSDVSNVFTQRELIKTNMTENGAHIRSLEGSEKGISFCLEQISDIIDNIKITSLRELPEVYINLDMLMTQFVYLSSIREYILKGGKSRGSYLIQDKDGHLPLEVLPETFRFSLEGGDLKDKVCEMVLHDNNGDLKCNSEWKDVRPIPDADNWFENVWNDYLQGKIIK